MAKSKKNVTFKQFVPDDIYAGLRFIGPGETVPHKLVYCEVVNRPTGIDFLDCFVGLLANHGHHYARWYAYRLGIGTFDFKGAVAALTGCTFVDFKDRYMQLLATDLLVQTDNTVSDIARRMGFPRACELSQFLRRVCRQSALQLRRTERRRMAAGDDASV